MKGKNTTILIIIVIVAFLFLFISKFQKVSCPNLTEEQCRAESDCIPVGTSLKAFLESGVEEEIFVFEECVFAAPEYDSCNEVVKMPQRRGGTKYSKECRCCCGIGPSCENNPYPQK